MMKKRRQSASPWQQLLTGSGAQRWSCSHATNAVGRECEGPRVEGHVGEGMLGRVLGKCTAGLCVGRGSAQGGRRAGGVVLSVPGIVVKQQEYSNRSGCSVEWVTAACSHATKAVSDKCVSPRERVSGMYLKPGTSLTKPLVAVQFSGLLERGDKLRIRGVGRPSSGWGSASGTRQSDSLGCCVCGQPLGSWPPCHATQHDPPPLSCNTA